MHFGVLVHIVHHRTCTVGWEYTCSTSHLQLCAIYKASYALRKAWCNNYDGLESLQCSPLGLGRKTLLIDNLN